MTSRSRAHTHPCRHCQTPVDCDGTLKLVYLDGIPEVICSWYHNANGSVEDVLCESCEAIICPVCQHAERPIGTYYRGRPYRYRRCAACEDGGEPDAQAVTLQEQYQRAADEKRRLG